jgi:DNA adenine methylase
MTRAALLEVGFDLVRLRSGARGRKILHEHPPYVPKARPFLKWAGGKQWLVPMADALLPFDFTGSYYEPFLGGGAVFFALAPPKAHLSDANADLISTYIGLRDDVDRMIRELRSYPHEREFFEGLRKRQPRASHTKAARLIYLNKTAFNGLYRVNRAGQFNVPFGQYANPTICNEPRLRSAASALQGAVLRSALFSEMTSHAGAGDVVYFDPPYITGHTNNGFLKYNARLFSWQDQLQLARSARALTKAGARVVISNADHPAVRSLYAGLYCYELSRRSAIGGGLAYRGEVRELLLTNFPLFDKETPKLP